MDEKKIKSIHKKMIEQKGLTNASWEKEALQTVISQLAVQPDKDLKDKILNLIREQEVSDYLDQLLEKEEKDNNAKLSHNKSFNDKNTHNKSEEHKN